jgi:hypothetical protein
LSIALFTALSGSPVSTAASVGVKRVSCVCILIPSLYRVYIEKPRSTGKRRRLDDKTLCVVVARDNPAAGRRLRGPGGGRRLPPPHGGAAPSRRHFSS